jgi:protein-S-isoprenylcysteine O-methyltransferase Ste14
VLIIIDPNVGNEMGKGTDDAVHENGNETSKLVVTLLHLGAFTILELLSVVKLYDPVSYMDWLLFIVATIGVCICYWAYWSLGKFYTFTIGIRKDHILVSSGPYRYLVHPGYVGQYMVIFGSLMFYNVDIIPTIALLAYMMYIYVRRMSYEEQMLTQQFGDEYKTFISERYHLFPFPFDLFK